METIVLMAPTASSFCLSSLSNTFFHRLFFLPSFPGKGRKEEIAKEIRKRRERRLVWRKSERRKERGTRDVLRTSMWFSLLSVSTLNNHRLLSQWVSNWKTCKEVGQSEFWRDEDDQPTRHFKKFNISDAWRKGCMKEKGRESHDQLFLSFETKVRETGMLQEGKREG